MKIKYFLIILILSSKWLGKMIFSLKVLLKPSMFKNRDTSIGTKMAYHRLTILSSFRTSSYSSVAVSSSLV